MFCEERNGKDAEAEKGVLTMMCTGNSVQRRRMQMIFKMRTNYDLDPHC